MRLFLDTMQKKNENEKNNELELLTQPQNW